MCKVAALMITFLGSAHGFIRRSGKVNVECKKKQITALVVLCIGNQKQTKNIGFFIFSFCW